MAKLKSISIDNFRSIEHVDLVFPDRAALILVGENNAGKSNIIAGIDILLGDVMLPTLIEIIDTSVVNVSLDYIR